MEEVFILTPTTYNSIDWTKYPDMTGKVVQITEGNNIGNYAVDVSCVCGCDNECELRRELESKQAPNMTPIDRTTNTYYVL